MNQEGKTIVITGAAGFIGSHLCAKYCAEGHRVIAVDNLQTTQTARNINHLFKNPRFTFIKHDIIEPLWVGEKLDWIMNFACSGSYTSYQYDPVHTTKTSTAGVVNILDLARRHGARIMQASTSEIYGNPLESPQREDYNGNVNPLGPRACYDEGKRAAETFCADYAREYGVDAKIVRIFNTYGPNMDVNDGRAMTNFIIAALDNKDVVIYGDGTHTRSFQYIDDLVRGIDSMMRKDGFLGPVNLGNPCEELSMRELAGRVIATTGSQSRIVYKEKATDDPVRRCPDITSARRELGWEPKMSLDEGLEKTIAYFRTAPRADKKVLVFATTYYPDLGPAERALDELSKTLPGTEFHIVTTRFRPRLPSFEKYGADSIYRVGFGSALDKYVLPIAGPWRALRLHREHRYRFAWSIMASYGGLAALLLKLFARDVNFLLTLDPLELDSAKRSKARIFAPLYRWIFKYADSVYVSDNAQELRAKAFSPSAKTALRGRSAEDFLHQIRATYADLVNRQDRKLARPR